MERILIYAWFYVFAISRVSLVWQSFCSFKRERTMSSQYLETSLISISFVSQIALSPSLITSLTLVSFPCLVCSVFVPAWWLLLSVSLSLYLSKFLILFQDAGMNWSLCKAKSRYYLEIKLFSCCGSLTRKKHFWVSDIAESDFINNLFMR